MGILIDNRQSRLPINEEKTASKARAVLSALGSPDAELSILVVDDDDIARLNDIYLHRQGPTNVIAFPMQEGPFAGLNANLLGDVVISADTAAAEADHAGIDMTERFDQLLVHGILHLFGFDHETEESDAREMEMKSDEMMAVLANLDL